MYPSHPAVSLSSMPMTSYSTSLLTPPTNRRGVHSKVGSLPRIHSKTQLLLISCTKRAPNTSLILFGHVIPQHLSEAPRRYHHFQPILVPPRWKHMLSRQAPTWPKLHHAPTTARRKIFKSVVIPTLEYCCTVWDSHLKKDISALESVQKFVGRYITQRWSSNIDSLRSVLRWKLVESRRRCTKLNVTYNIRNNLSWMPQSTFTYHPSPYPHPHNKMFLKPYVPTQS